MTHKIRCATQLHLDGASDVVKNVHTTRKFEGPFMNLAMVLHFNNLNRNTFTTLDRRTGLRFMKRSLIEGAKHNRYTFVHATALGCMLAFQNAGVEAKRASDVVDDVLNYIDAIVDGLASGQRDAERSWLTIVNYANGTWGWACGTENADTFGVGAVVSKISISILAVWDKFADRLGEPLVEPQEQESADG